MLFCSSDKLTPSKVFFSWCVPEKLPLQNKKIRQRIEVPNMY